MGGTYAQACSGPAAARPLHQLLPQGLLCLALRRRRAVLLPLSLAGYRGRLALLFFAPRFRLPDEPLMGVVDATALWQVSVWWMRQWAAGPRLREAALPWRAPAARTALSPLGRIGA